MAIPASTVSSYAPWGNAELAFEVGTGTAITDTATGNAIQATEVIEYLAALSLQPPNWKPESGVDATSYACRGRLLSPATLDPRITNGSQADCVINGPTRPPPRFGTSWTPAASAPVRHASSTPTAP